MLYQDTKDTPIDLETHGTPPDGPTPPLPSNKFLHPWRTDDKGEAVVMDEPCKLPSGPPSPVVPNADGSPVSPPTQHPPSPSESLCPVTPPKKVFTEKHEPAPTPPVPASIPKVGSECYQQLRAGYARLYEVYQEASLENEQLQQVLSEKNVDLAIVVKERIESELQLAQACIKYSEMLQESRNNGDKQLAEFDKRLAEIQAESAVVQKELAHRKKVVESLVAQVHKKNSELAEQREQLAASAKSLSKVQACAKQDEAKASSALAGQAMAESALEVANGQIRYFQYASYGYPVTAPNEIDITAVRPDTNTAEFALFKKYASVHVRHARAWVWYIPKDKPLKPFVSELKLGSFLATYFRTNLPHGARPDRDVLTTLKEFAHSL